MLNIYCDESCHLENDHQKVMAIAGIACPDYAKRSIYRDIKLIKPLSGNWTLVDQTESRYVYENQSYRVYVTKDSENDGYIVVLAHNNWLELLHL